MFSFLGELIELVVWLVQQGCMCLKRAMGRSADLLIWIVTFLGIGLRHSSWPAIAAHRLAVGPPQEDWIAHLSGEFRSAHFVTALLPSRQHIRG
ncbi:MAG: hypothetical protein WCJ09_29240 [Planctomycetota bacterium]